MNRNKFFRTSDWIACWVTFIVSLLVYTLTLQPTLGLEDSGELIVASDYLGVPHPPGYPIWSLLTWFFQWVLHGVTFHGHPNPAWGVNFFSAFAGAAACGVLALLISRSGMDLLRSLKKESDTLGEPTESLFCCVAGISGGLLLAFGQGMWSQAVIAEVYTLNILFQSLVLIFLYRWMSEPAKIKWLMLCAFVFGLGITNHQTLMFMGLAIAVGVVFNELEIFCRKNLVCIIAAIVTLIVAGLGVYHNQLALQFIGVIGCMLSFLLIRQPHLVRDFVIVGVFYILLLGVNKWADTSPEYAHLMWKAGPDHIGFWIWTVYALLVPTIATFILPNGRVVGPTFLLMFIGLGFYLYMPISSDQNPPINWGYPRTWEGFMHAVTRGQYERVKLAHVFTPRFLEQVRTYLTDLRSQFYWPIAILGLIPILFFPLLRQDTGARFSYKGRIGRFEFFYWMGTWILLLGLTLVAIASYPPIVSWAILSAHLAMVSLPVVKRLHDLGLSGKWYWLYCVPGLNLLFFLYLWVWKGNEEENRYGEDPLRETQSLATRYTAWILTTLVAFLSVGIVFMILQNPKTDIQSLFIGRVQYIQSHAIFVTWLGYGILLIMACLETLAKNNPITKAIGIVMVLLLPFALIYKNYYNEPQLRVYGGAEQNGHDYGWQFGNWQLRGVNGIEEDLRYWYSPEEFEEVWASYPNKEYPQPMGTNAIFFGGTDPGRFVPTYMIYSAHVRPDVYLITQNALADGTYMNVMRDLYGDQIWIPSPHDVNLAFQMYITSERGRDPQASISNEDGKVQVRGVREVMQINGYLSKMIFDHNQYITESRTDEKTRPVGAAVVHQDPSFDPITGLPPKRTFYVEESYAMEWMYPYLTPHGLIMKVNSEPTKLTEEMIKNDTDFWNWYCSRLLSDQRFIRDIAARKAFCKLRTSLAGLYDLRGHLKEAEVAYRQAISLYDLSQEAVVRYAGFLARVGRSDEALRLVEDYLVKDPNSQQIESVLASLKQRTEMTEEITFLQNKLQNKKAGFDDVLKLLKLNLQLGQVAQADSLARQLIQGEVSAARMQQILQLLYSAKRYPLVEQGLIKITTMTPDDPSAWVNLATFQLALNKQNEMLNALRQAVEIGGEPVRNIIRSDKHFDAVRHLKEFQEIVPPLRLPSGTRPAQNPGFF